MKKVQWPRYTIYENYAKKNVFFSDDFGLRNPVIQKTFETKSDTSIVARAYTAGK